MDRILLLETAFDPWQMVARHEAGLSLPELGASNVFVGRMRHHNEGDSVEALFLEHYPGMTERQLARIGADAAKQWPLQDYLLVHRVGSVVPGEALVLVAAWSSHRKAAREACGFMLEKLKFEAPFWKRERLSDGRERWVEKNTQG